MIFKRNLPVHLGNQFYPFGIVYDSMDPDIREALKEKSNEANFLKTSWQLFAEAYSCLHWYKFQKVFVPKINKFNFHLMKDRKYLLYVLLGQSYWLSHFHLQY